MNNEERMLKIIKLDLKRRFKNVKVKFMWL